MPKQKRIFLITALVLTVVAGVCGVYWYSTSKKQDTNKCQSQTDATQKLLCFKKIIDTYLQSGQIDKSFDVVAQMYDKDSVFDANCHDFTHSIGKEAYNLFSKNKEFIITAKASYCAYGFYHGFMENLVAGKGDVATARNFCSYIDSQLAENTPGAKLACYHGIGHGWTNVHDPAVWGNEEAMIIPALRLCEKVAGTAEELKICATGVFDSISIGYYNSAYGLKINKIDPYWLCKKQVEEYKVPCYMDLTPAIVWLGNYRLDASLAYLKGVEKQYKGLVIETIAEDNVRFILRDQLNVVDQIAACRNLGGVDVGDCLHGLTSGYIQFGSPGHEEDSVFAFCNSETLNMPEKNQCFSDALKILSYSFSKERYKEICTKAPDQYKKYCI